MSLQREQQFFEIGKKLENSPHSKDALLKILKQAASTLSEVDQSPSDSMLKAMKLSMDALVTEEILRHRDRDVRLLVATCISEITRITAPAAPYSDDVLREIFRLIVSSFHGLDDIQSPSFGTRVTILETVAKVRSCVVMLDLECDDLILEMFQIFFSTASDSHPENVLLSMQTIMVLVLDESEDVSEQLLAVLLANLSLEKRDISPAAYRLAANVIGFCAVKLEPHVSHFLRSAMLAERNSQSNLQKDCHEIIYNIYQCAPEMLQSIIPILSKELLTDQLDVRLKVVKLLGRLFSFPCHSVGKAFQLLFSEFLKRFTDKAVEVRSLVVGYVKECLLANPLRLDASDIIAALSDRLLDNEENIRRKVVAAICDLGIHTLQCIPIGAIRQVADCLHDTMVSVRKYTLERLAEVYRVYCSKCSGGLFSSLEFDWIPGKLLRCCYDKDFRVQAVEVVFTESLFPYELSVAERVKRWIAMFSECDQIGVKAFEKLLSQKQRFQLEMQGFLSLQQKMKEDDTAHLQNQILRCFKSMSDFLKDPELAEEDFQKLNQMKDKSIWKALSSLLDPGLTFFQAQATCDDLLKLLGEKHPQYEFMKIVAMKCSHLLFGKEHVKELLKEIAVNKLAGKDDIVLSGMNLLVLFTGYFPMLVEGVEEDLLQLLKEDDDHIKEGVVHILAKAGGSIREQVTDTIGSVDLLLETLCLEGSRKQAKYAVQAIGSITKDSGHKALSVLYKKLVDVLESGTHLSTVLQSLGCIAQIAMPVFETREDDVIHFVCRKLLRQSSNPADVSETKWEERSEECFLKICGIKTLVKSYLPNKDAHLRQRIKALFGVLTKLITSGEIYDDVKSSKVDKAHLRLAAGKAVLRLSRQWDSCITPRLLHLTLRLAQDDYPHVRREFLTKVHQYLKERVLHHKYACAFALSIPAVTEHDLTESRQYLTEFFETCRGSQLYQPCGKFDGVPFIDSQENTLSYLVHILGHHPDFPVPSESLSAESLEPFYWQLHFFLSGMLHLDEGTYGEAGKTSKAYNIPSIVKTFQTIKRMEDAVDKSKSENLYTLCDIGLMITKALLRHMDNSGDDMRSISLPGLLYRPLKGSEIQLKVDGNHYPACLAGNAALSNLESANFCGGNEKWLRRNADETAPEEDDEGSTKTHSLKQIRNKKAQQKGKESVSGEPIIPEAFKPQEVAKVNSNRLLNATGLEYERGSEQIGKQQQSRMTQLMPKRKVGRPSKVPTELVTQGLKQDHVVKDSGDMLSSRPRRGYQRGSVRILDAKEETELPGFKKKFAKHSKRNEEKDSNDAKKHMKRKTSDIVPEQLNFNDDNKICSNAETLVSAKRRRGRPCKDKSVLVSSGQKQVLSQRVPEGLELTQRKRGRPKGSGKKKTTKLDADDGEVTKTMEKSLLVSRKVLTEKGSPDSNSAKRRLHTKSGAFPESAEMRLSEDVKYPEDSDVKYPEESLRKPFKKSIGALEKSPRRFEVEDKEGERLVGRKIKVWWPLDEQFYVGLVDSYDSKQGKHKIIYLDGDVELLRLQREQWELIDVNSRVDEVMAASIASLKSVGDMLAKKRIVIDESSVMKEGKMESACRRGTSLSSVGNETAPKSNGNLDDHIVLPRRFNSNSFRTKASGEATLDPFVSIDDSEQHARSSRTRTEQDLEEKKSTQQTVSAKQTTGTLKNPKKTKETRKTADDKQQGSLYDSYLRDSDELTLNVWELRKSKLR